MPGPRLTLLPATELARLVRAREISPVEVVRAHLAEIEERNPALNAFVGIDAARARREALAAEGAVVRGEALGPLHGVPVSIKSSIAVEGLPWETGTRLRAGVTGDADAPLVARLRGAGAIVLGVTNVAEQLMAWETANPIYGRTNSPWDPERTPGGSSGGEAAAIAAGLSAGGIGSDGGGSIRVPAHFCGIAGLKPTPGRVPATGHFPPTAGPFSLMGVVGPMARTVDDVALLLSVVAGPDDDDPNGHPVGSDPTATTTRVGFFEDDGHTPVTPETRAAVRRAAAALAAAGYDVGPFRPSMLDEALALWRTLFVRAVHLLLEPLVAGHEADCHPNFVQFLEWARREPRLTADELLLTEIRRDELRARVRREMREIPILLCPVAAVPAFRHGEREWQVGGTPVHYLDAWRYSAWFNLLQNPGLSVPAGRSPEGLPIGVQVVARHWEEGAALEAGRIIEHACQRDSARPTAS